VNAFIEIRNATIHNLKKVSARIRKRSFTCIVGPSGSGKSSFAIDLLLRSCMDPSFECSSGDNVVLNAIPALALRQRVHIDAHPISVARYLGLPTYLKHKVSNCAPCLQCNEQGAIRALIPERAVVHPEQALLRTALHPILRKVFTVARDRLPRCPAQISFGSMRKETQNEFLFGTHTGSGWRGLHEELLQAAAMNLLDLSVLDLENAFYHYIPCPSCDGLCVTGNRSEIGQSALRFGDAIPAGAIFDGFIDRGVIPLGMPVPNLSLCQFQWTRLCSTLKEVKPDMLVLLDEPTAGMCASDAFAFVQVCKALVDFGCTVVVIEHSPHVMLHADHLLEFGPGGGSEGGDITFAGTLREFSARSSGSAGAVRRLVTSSISRTRPIQKRGIRICGIHERGLDDVELVVPEFRFTCIAGSIGTGKSGAVDATFRALDKSASAWMGRMGIGEVFGRNKIRRPHLVDQKPIGLNPHSIPLTYIEGMNALRECYCAIAKNAKKRLDLSHFSFNTKNGRCDCCNGYGCVETVVGTESYWSKCSACNGLRYSRTVNEIKYKGISIGEALRLTVSEAKRHFKSEPTLVRKLGFLEKVGLGYLSIGQPSNSLSGGESQRVKIARQLAKRLGDRTVYLLDTPSRGLSVIDAERLAIVLRELSQRNTVLIADNHPYFVMNCDWLILLEKRGQRIRQIYSGPPDEAAAEMIEKITGRSQDAHVMRVAK